MGTRGERRNEEEMRVGGKGGVGGEGEAEAKREKGRLRAHVEVITVRVKTQSFFTVHFFAEERW